MRVAVQAATDVGLRRESNEDHFALWIPEDAGERERRGALLLVADGMGGAKAGEVASRVAVETVVRGYRESTAEEPIEALRGAVEAANQAVHDLSRAQSDLRGMGTTCTAVVVRSHDVSVVHVGDSRAYLVRGDSIRQLTRDHSLVAQLVSERLLTPEQARTDPRRNVVTRSIGVGATIEVDRETLEGGLREGDTLVLCTDGLHGLVSDRELAVTASQPDLEQSCRDLVALARERGGPDNITVLLARPQSGAVGRAAERHRTADAVAPLAEAAQLPAGPATAAGLDSRPVPATAAEQDSRPVPVTAAGAHSGPVAVTAADAPPRPVPVAASGPRSGPQSATAGARAGAGSGRLVWIVLALVLAAVAVFFTLRVIARL